MEVPKSFLSTLKAGFFSSAQTGLETALLAGYRVRRVLPGAEHDELRFVWLSGGVSGVGGVGLEERAAWVKNLCRFFLGISGCGGGSAPMASDVTARLSGDSTQRRRDTCAGACAAAARGRRAGQKNKRELERREVDDAIGSRPRGLPAAAGSDPVGGFVSGQHVADLGDAVGWAADHGEPLQRKGRPGAVSEKVLALASMGCDRSTPRLPSGLPARHAA
ncbi:hypothetical protein LBMAG47_28270 [Planctomycetia bacterium]|nr:hypothetical protein LBMAG47_28270 [Planctomycetia bacterium]